MTLIAFCAKTGVDAGFSPLAGELHLPEKNWALPKHLPTTTAAGPAAGGAGAQGTAAVAEAAARPGGGTQGGAAATEGAVEGEAARGPVPAKLPHINGGAEDLSSGGGGGDGAAFWQDPPTVLQDLPGLCCWYKRDTSTGLPKVIGD